MRKIIKCLAALALCHSMTAKAALITITFEAIVFDGTFAGEVATGEFTYDDINIVTNDNPSFDGDISTIGFAGTTLADFEDLISFSLTFLGQVYSGSDDLNFPDTPTIDFYDSVPDYIDFYVEEGTTDSGKTVDIAEPSIESFQIDSLFYATDPALSNVDFELDMFVTERTFNPVNSPATIFLLLLGLWAVFRPQPLSNFTFN